MSDRVLRTCALRAVRSFSAPFSAAFAEVEEQNVQQPKLHRLPQENAFLGFPCLRKSNGQDFEEFADQSLRETRQLLSGLDKFDTETAFSRVENAFLLCQAALDTLSVASEETESGDNSFFSISFFTHGHAELVARREIARSALAKLADEGSKLLRHEAVISMLQQAARNDDLDTDTRSKVRSFLRQFCELGVFDRSLNVRSKNDKQIERRVAETQRALDVVAQQDFGQHDLTRENESLSTADRDVFNSYGALARFHGQDCIPANALDKAINAFFSQELRRKAMLVRDSNVPEASIQVLQRLREQLHSVAQLHGHANRADQQLLRTPLGRTEHAREFLDDCLESLAPVAAMQLREAADALQVDVEKGAAWNAQWLANTIRAVSSHSPISPQSPREAKTILKSLPGLLRRTYPNLQLRGYRDCFVLHDRHSENERPLGVMYVAVSTSVPSGVRPVRPRGTPILFEHVTDRHVSDGSLPVVQLSLSASASNESIVHELGHAVFALLSTNLHHSCLPWLETPALVSEALFSDASGRPAAPLAATHLLLQQVPLSMACLELFARTDVPVARVWGEVVDKVNDAVGLPLLRHENLSWVRSVSQLPQYQAHSGLAYLFGRTVAAACRHTALLRDETHDETALRVTQHLMQHENGVPPSTQLRALLGEDVFHERFRCVERVFDSAGEPSGVVPLARNIDDASALLC